MPRDEHLNHRISSLKTIRSYKLKRSSSGNAVNKTICSLVAATGTWRRFVYVPAFVRRGSKRTKDSRYRSSVHYLYTYVNVQYQYVFYSMDLYRYEPFYHQFHIFASKAQEVKETIRLYRDQETRRTKQNHNHG